MKVILFFADGSPRCQHAARLAISLASKLDCEIVAQFVVDPQRIFSLEGYEGLPGLCGSGVFVETQQDMMVPLMNLGDSLLMSFAALAEGAGVRVTQFIDVGDTTEELKKRAVEADADLVVIAEAPSIISNLEPLVSCLILSVESSAGALVIEPENANQTHLSQLLEHLRKMSVVVQLRKNLGGSVFRIKPMEIADAESAGNFLVIDQDRGWRQRDALVIDQDRGWRRLMSSELEILGMEVDAEACSEAILQRGLTHRYALIFLGLNGDKSARNLANIHTLHALERQQHLEPTPVVAYTRDASMRKEQAHNEDLVMIHSQPIGIGLLQQDVSRWAGQQMEA